MVESVVRCPKCGHKGIVITELLDNDLAIICDAQEAQIKKLSADLEETREAAQHFHNAMDDICKNRARGWRAAYEWLQNAKTGDEVSDE